MGYLVTMMTLLVMFYTVEGAERERWSEHCKRCGGNDSSARKACTDHRASRPTVPEPAPPVVPEAMAGVCAGLGSVRHGRMSNDAARFGDIVTNE